MQVAAWQIIDGVPVRASHASLDLEKDLESWIERDPVLVDDGLTVVARQAQLPSAGRADLLAVDRVGRWVVIEIKAGALYRETIAQALDYAAFIAAASPTTLRQVVDAYFAKQPDAPRPAESAPVFDVAPREVQVIVVGSGSAVGVERLASYLGGFNVPIRSVIFQVLEVEGALMLVREVAESDEPPVAISSSSAVTVEAVLSGADQPVRTAMQTVISHAMHYGLGIRPYKRSVMITPPQNRTRALITLWNLGATAELFVSASKFEQFFDIKPEVVRATFGPLDENGNRALDQDAAAQVVAGLDALIGDKNDVLSGTKT